MDTIKFEDFAKVDIRIGTVTEAIVPEWSHWVMKITVDLGPELGTKTCFSGIMKFYKPEDLIGKQFPFVVNLEPKKTGPDRELSEVMMVMAVPDPENEDLPAGRQDTPPVLFRLQKKVANGVKVL